MTRFRTRRLDGPVDPLAFAGDDGWLFLHEGQGVAGRGPAVRVDSTAVMGALAALTPTNDSDPDGPGPVAIGSRPFRPDAAWALAICALQLVIDDQGTAWETTVGDVTPEPPAPAPITAPTVALETVDDPDTWCNAVTQATSRIRQGKVDKIVLAREVLASADGPLSPVGIVRRLQDGFPTCYLFSVDGLVGASPELLVERDGDTVRARPMAGTARRSNDPSVDEARLADLFASKTYRHEHQVTIDMVHDTLLSFASFVDEEPEPHIVRLANVAHLATRVTGLLSQPAASVLELVNALHPTPAVCGRPRDAALQAITELEPNDRGRYAGTVGWVDAAGNGTWAVTVRCAQLDRDTRRSARIHAGCGLVADSDPVTELAESLQGIGVEPEA